MIKYTCDNCGASSEKTSIYEVKIGRANTPNDEIIRHYCEDCTYLLDVHQALCGPFYDTGAHKAIKEFLHG